MNPLFTTEHATAARRSFKNLERNQVIQMSNFLVSKMAVIGCQLVSPALY